jgi:glutathione S-transferase
LEDAGIKYNFEEITLDWTTWPKHKSEIMSNGFRCGTLPIMELEGRKYSQTNAILMYLCSRLGQYLIYDMYSLSQYIDQYVGKYLGDDIEEQYKVNQAADLCADWYTARIIAFVSGKVSYSQQAEIVDFLWH